MTLRIKIIKRNHHREPMELKATEARPRSAEREMKKTIESWIHEFRNKRRSVNAVTF